MCTFLSVPCYKHFLCTYMHFYLHDWMSTFLSETCTICKSFAAFLIFTCCPKYRYTTLLPLCNAVLQVDLRGLQNVTAANSKIISPTFQWLLLVTKHFEVMSAKIFHSMFIFYQISETKRGNQQFLHRCLRAIQTHR